MTKHEADVIGGLNMTDQVSNEAYKQIMIAAQEENEVGDVLDKIISEATSLKISYTDHDKDTYRRGVNDVLKIIDKHISGK